MASVSFSSQTLLDAIAREKSIFSDLQSLESFKKTSSLVLLQKCHEENALLLDNFLNLYGWPIPSQFGEDIHEAACLIALQATSLPNLQLRFLTCLHRVLKRYNIALLALEKAPYIQEAQKLFSKNYKNYILGDESLPHITLCQFYAEDGALEGILKDVKKIKAWPSVNFTGISFQKEKNTPFWWAELSVLCEASLLNFQSHIMSLLKQYKTVPLNLPENLYRPHLTLARVTSLKIKAIHEDLLTQRPFTLALGESDFFGQFVKTRY
ncbi:MAG: hypothetical protein JSS34_02415 [Proteobacteria bacterium]|nr:hypothetical protein [Pseudomonadota bacterium]